jgi:DNA-directed RNA polymerase subunit RPC12/RpoP
MTNDDHVDGNALGSLLIDVFGREMTDTIGCCASCGAENAVGALIVYRSGPGDVIRCPSCGSVVIVASSLPDRPRVYLTSLRWLEAPS